MSLLDPVQLKVLPRLVNVTRLLGVEKLPAGVLPVIPHAVSFSHTHMIALPLPPGRRCDLLCDSLVWSRTHCRLTCLLLHGGLGRCKAFQRPREVSQNPHLGSWPLHKGRAPQEHPQSLCHLTAPGEDTPRGWGLSSRQVM